MRLKIERPRSSVQLEECSDVNISILDILLQPRAATYFTLSESPHSQKYKAESDINVMFGVVRNYCRDVPLLW